MKRIISSIIISLTALAGLQSCLSIDGISDAYGDDLKSVAFVLEPAGEVLDLGGAILVVKDINAEAVYEAECGADGSATLKLPCGVYMAMASISGPDMPEASGSPSPRLTYPCFSMRMPVAKSSVTLPV